MSPRGAAALGPGTHSLDRFVTDTRKLFLLSPANCAGRRAGMLLDGRLDFELAMRLRSEGAPLGELFAFMSGLYFRGKLAYAWEFARPSEGDGVRVITPGRGLLAADTMVSLAELREIAEVPVELDEPRYREPLARDAERLAATLPAAAGVILLGSVATDKYMEPLTPALGPHLLIPAEFVGRGDMSRGGLMLRCVDAGEELTYVPALGIERRGSRPPRLTPRWPRRDAS